MKNLDELRIERLDILNKIGMLSQLLRLAEITQENYNIAMNSLTKTLYTLDMAIKNIEEADNV